MKLNILIQSAIMNIIIPSKVKICQKKNGHHQPFNSYKRLTKLSAFQAPWSMVSPTAMPRIAEARVAVTQLDVDLRFPPFSTCQPRSNVMSNIET